MESVFTTDDLPESERFAFWRDEVLRQTGCMLDVDAEGASLFHTALRTRVVGNSVLGVHRTSASRVTRGRPQIARCDNDTCALVLQVGGRLHFRHDGGDLSVGRGDMFLVDNTSPWDCRQSDGNRGLWINLPRAALASRLPRLPTISRLGRQQRLNGLLDSFLRSLAPPNPPLPAEQGEALSGHFMDLLALALGNGEAVHEDSGESVTDALKAARLPAIDDFVEAHLGDPRLTPEMVAARFGISTRYLHRLFEERGLSFSRWLLGRRLERCRRDLASPSLALRSITEIAFHWGFNDLTHFGRRFREAYGMTPRDWRQSAAQDASGLE